MALISIAYSSLASGKIASSEYAIKAVVLVNFLKHVSWPTDAFPNSDRISIGILGENPFGDIFVSLTGSVVAGRSLEVKNFKKFDADKDILDCQLLFIGSSDRKYIKRILKSLGDHSILTVSESNNFMNDGGMISLFVQNNHVRFDINQQAASDVRLEIGSELLRNARDVIRKD